MCKTGHPSVSCVSYPFMVVGWSQSPGQVSSLSRGPTNKDKQPFVLTFTPTGGRHVYMSLDSGRKFPQKNHADTGRRTCKLHTVRPPDKMEFGPKKVFLL